MTNLEHLIENGLEAIKTLKREDWLRFMAKDINLPETDIMLSDLWEICQYVQYTYVPAEEENMRVVYNNYKGGDMKFKDLPVGAPFVIKKVPVVKEVPEPASVYIKIDPVGVYNCINVIIGKPGCMVSNAIVFPIDAELRWKYEE